MDRYMTWTGEKAHRVSEGELQWRGGMQSLCGQWVHKGHKAKRNAPRCQVCERRAARGKAVSKP